ncbi:MAG: flagellar motor protein MotB [Alphaproteobacteria bacterium]
MADSANQPVIMKRPKKRAPERQHGGQWKVAYADFTTAMMAFFLMLWLLNSTTREQMAGIADYFSPTAASKSTSGAGGVLGGTSMLSPGAMTTPMSAAGVAVSLQPLKDEDEPDYEGLPREKPAGADAEKREQKQFERAEAALREAIEATPDLREFSQNLLIDTTDEGMRIQIVDADQRSMFPVGSSNMYAHTERLLQKVVQAIISLPNDIAVTGHTDASLYRSRSGYTNWELSTDRANASRRVLVASGLPDWRVLRVEGKANREPLIEDDPYSPQNRRISIVLLREIEKNPEQ